MNGDQDMILVCIVWEAVQMLSQPDLQWMRAAHNQLFAVSYMTYCCCSKLQNRVQALGEQGVR